MKPQFLKIAPPANASFNLYQQAAPFFSTPWHYHPEYEIVLIKQSHGKKYIGSSITDFEEGDLTMIGAFLPHFYKNPPQYYKANSPLIADSYVIHFREDCFGEEFWNLPEMQAIKDLMTRAKKGLQFSNNVSLEVKKLIAEIFESEGISKIMGLIKLLQALSATKEFVFLNENSMELRNEADSDRIRKVFEHVMQNFQTEISLNGMAQLANMSESAFSRYFKKRTRNTFSNFLAGVRIEYACQQLRESEKSISEIAFESGFNNLSNFNRQFKILKKQTPFSYKKEHS